MQTNSMYWSDIDTLHHPMQSAMWYLSHTVRHDEIVQQGNHARGQTVYYCVWNRQSHHCYWRDCAQIGNDATRRNFGKCQRRYIAAEHSHWLPAQHSVVAEWSFAAQNSTMPDLSTTTSTNTSYRMFIHDSTWLSFLTGLQTFFKDGTGYSQSLFGYSTVTGSSSLLLLCNLPVYFVQSLN